VREEVFEQRFSQKKGTDGILYNTRQTLKDCTATESFECNNFPFDVQDLSLCYDADNSVDAVHLVPSRVIEAMEVMHINKTFLALCDWTIEHYDVTEEFVDFAKARSAGLEKERQRAIDLDSFDVERIEYRYGPFLLFPNPGSKEGIWLRDAGSAVDVLTVTERALHFLHSSTECVGPPG